MSYVLCGRSALGGYQIDTKSECAGVVAHELLTRLSLFSAALIAESLLNATGYPADSRVKGCPVITDDTLVAGHSHS